MLLWTWCKFDLENKTVIRVQLNTGWIFNNGPDQHYSLQEKMNSSSVMDRQNCWCMCLFLDVHHIIWSFKTCHENLLRVKRLIIQKPCTASFHTKQSGIFWPVVFKWHTCQVYPRLYFNDIIQDHTLETYPTTGIVVYSLQSFQFTLIENI